VRLKIAFALVRLSLQTGRLHIRFQTSFFHTIHGQLGGGPRGYSALLESSFKGTMRLSTNCIVRAVRVGRPTSKAGGTVLFSRSRRIDYSKRLTSMEDWVVVTSNSWMKERKGPGATPCRRIVSRVSSQPRMTFYLLSIFSDLSLLIIVPFSFKRPYSRYIGWNSNQKSALIY
jgi:hypothetical protein